MMNNPKKKTLASINKLVCEHFDCARSIIVEIESSKDADTIRRKSAVVLFTSVMAVETFFNIYFYCVAKQANNISALKTIKDDLANKKPIDRKIREWPQLVLGRKIDLSKGAGQEFIKVKFLRNSLAHFGYSDTRIDIERIAIDGLADISNYQSLDKNSAKSHYRTSIRFIEEILKCRNIGTEQTLLQLRLWTGEDQF